MAEIYAKNLIQELTFEQVVFPSTSLPYQDGVNGATEQQTTVKTVDTTDTYYYPTIIGGQFEGATFKTSYSGARLEIFPEYDTTIGMVVYDNQAIPAEVFKVIIDGTDVGDLIIGNYAGAQGAKWDKSAGTFDIKGIITAYSGIIGGWVLTTETFAASGLTFNSTTGAMTIGTTNSWTINGTTQAMESANYVPGVAGAGFHLDNNYFEIANIAMRGLIRTSVFQRSVHSVMGGCLSILDGDVLDADMTAADS
jgi:hypothetical protein